MPHAMSTNTKVYVDGYDISGDSSSVEVGATAVMADDSAFGVTGHTHVKGILDDTLTYEGFFDDAWNGSAEVGGVDYIFAQLRTSTTQNADIISAYPNLDTVGQPGWAATVDCSTYTAPVKVAELVTVKASFGLEGGAMKVKSLGAKATITATTTGTVIDDGASSAKGGTWFIHIFAITATGGAAKINVTLQDSPDNITFTEVGTQSYDLTGSTPQQFFYSFTGTLNRYVNLLVTKNCTTMSLSYQAGYHRGQNGPTN